MRLCVPSTGIAPGSGSGGEVYSRELLRSLVRLGDEPHVLLAKGKPCPPDLTRTVEPIWPAQGLRWPVANLVFPAWIARCLRVHGGAVAVSHALRYTGFPVVVAARRAGHPSVVHCHHVEFALGTAALERWVLRSADSVVVDSDFVAGQVLRHRVRPEGIIRVHCGSLAPDGARRASPRLPRVLSVGPMVPRKDPVGAVRVVARAGLPVLWALHWIGRGSLAARAEAEAARVGVRLRRHERISEPDKWDAYRRASVYLATSRLEGFPLAGLEAAALGLPIVAYRAASWPELVVDGETGLLGDTEDELAAHLVRLASDRTLRERMGEAGARRVRTHFRWDQMVAGVQAVYRKA